MAANRLCKTEELEAAKRVLALVDGYLSMQDQTALHAWDGGVMTYEELRQHIAFALDMEMFKGVKAETRNV